MESRASQCAKVLHHLQTYGSITTYHAYDKYRITRLPARIKDLRRRGVLIKTTMIRGKNADGTIKKYGIYSLMED